MFVHIGLATVAHFNDYTTHTTGGAGWTEPCHSSLEWWPGGSERYLPGLWSPGATEVTFRHLASAWHRPEMHLHVEARRRVAKANKKKQQ